MLPPRLRSRSSRDPRRRTSTSRSPETTTPCGASTTAPSLPDIEAQFSPQNYLVTHSILYTVDPFSQMGVLTTTKLNDNWTVQLGVNGSNDVAVWNSAARASLQACVRERDLPARH